MNKNYKNNNLLPQNNDSKFKNYTLNAFNSIKDIEYFLNNLNKFNHYVKFLKFFKK